MARLESLGALVPRLRYAERVEPVKGAGNISCFQRMPYGPGWALVGDAGLSMDPVTGQGIGNAFRDAERMATAIDAIFSGKESFETALTEYERLRNEETFPMYEFTSQITEFSPAPIEQKALFEAMAHKPEAVDQYLGALTGSVSLQEFFSPRSMLKIMGIGGMGRIFLSNLISGRKLATIPNKAD